VLEIKRLAADYRNGDPLCQTNGGVIWSVVPPPADPWSVVQIVQIAQVVEIVKTVQTDFLSSLVCLLTSDF
jgi:hypothetical protein